MDLTNESVSRNIKACRVRAGFNQHDIVARTGLSRALISKMENYPFAVRLTDLKKYADALELSMKEFLGM